MRNPPLLLSRRFAPLFCCQFFAAFNDNFLKTALVFLILFRPGGGNTAALITLASAALIAPYFILSGLAGQLADRHDKARVAQWVKFVELFVAAVAAFGYLQQSLSVLFAALIGFGVVAALFAPIKYGILPDHLQREQLPTANAMIEGATFIAILTGTIVGGLASRGGGDPALFAALIMSFALACWLTALLIPPSGQGAPHLRVTANIAASTVAMLRHLRADTRLWWGAMVTSWFWLTGIVVLSLLPTLIKVLIGGNEDTVTAYLALFTIAVGVGSGLAAAIARGRIVLTTTVVGGLLVAAFALDLGVATLGLVAAATPQGPGVVLASASGIRVAVDLAGVAVGGGLFIVPAFAAVQAWAGAEYRARTVAACNMLNAAAMTVVTVTVAALQRYGVAVPTLFMAIGAATLLVALAIWWTMPKGSASS